MRIRLGVIGGVSLAACLWAATEVARADNPSSVTLARLTASYEQGAFLDTASAAETAGGADELALAARSLLAYCLTGEGEPPRDIVARARQAAEAALAINPRHEEARLQLAIALSLQARGMDLMAAWKSGLGDQSRELAEAVLAANPDNHYAHGFLAVWNVEVRRRAGPMGAGMMRADLDRARRHFRIAARLAPADVGLRWQWARALVALDARRHADEALASLREAASLSPANEVDEVMQARAIALLDALARDRDRAAALALDML